ncbi:MAG: hypothetical protein LBL65_05710 [Campylobacteraceae bacterium]|jgi:hypothetical protein|nr:hypothetical protein [Campylobacteraceae bacterium]
MTGIIDIDARVTVEIDDVIGIIEDGEFDADEIERVAQALLDSDNGFEILEKIDELRS